MGDISKRARAGAARLTRGRLALLTGASLMAPASLAIQAIRGQDQGELVIAVGSAALFLLVLVRMSGLVRQVQSKMDQLDAQGFRLREAEAKYRSVVENIPAITYLQEVDREDPDGRQTVFVSPQVEAILGFTPEEWMRSRRWLDLLHPDDRDRVLAADRTRMATGEPLREEYRLLTGPFRMVWVHEEAELVRDEPGSPQVWQGVLFDITAQKLAEHALRKALNRERDAASRLRALDEMKTTFLHAVSHELRTPLATILGASLTLDRQDLKLSAQNRFDLLRSLAANARKLDRLLSDLLDLNRLDRGIMEPSRRPTDMRDLLHRVVQESEVLTGRTVEVEAPSREVMVDAAKVERIVENLLRNTVRHTPPDTPVWVRAGLQDGGVVIAVEDSGPGVPAELREQIFAAFVRGPTARPHAPGVGIGLSLVARFAELHGGRAWVEERPGGGSSFKVFLPAEVVEQPREGVLAAKTL